MKLMIVDDDYQIREGMHYGVDWEKLGIGEVSTFENGLEALKAFSSYAPDIILSDIQMPGMTGLEFITEIRRVNAEVRVIFISAYSEFEYCQQALQLGADDYILKPIQFLKLEEIIKKNVEILCKKRSLETQYFYALLEREVRSVYLEGKDREKELYELLRTEYPFIGDGRMLTLIICLPASACSLAVERKREIVVSLKEVLFEEESGVLFPVSRGQWVVLVRGSDSAFMASYRQRELKNRVLCWNSLYGGTFGEMMGGISGAHRYQEFRKGYQEAQWALAYGFYQPEVQVNIYMDHLYHEYLLEETTALFSKFRKSVQENDYTEVEKELVEWKKAILQAPPNPEKLKEAVWSFLQNMDREQRIMDFSSDLKQRIWESCSLNALTELFGENLFDLWKGKKKKAEEKHYSRSVKAAIVYVERYYAQPLTQSQVAEVVGKSSNYFGTVFKKETGSSFTEYLTRYRMEQAKKMLLYTNKKIKEVSEAVGYTDYVYFSQVFRQVYGCSASQFRQREEK